MDVSIKYKGIAPYDEKDQADFVGRTDETWALYDRICRNDYTVYYAASGEGKSSLIKAGLLPILRRRNYFPIYITFEDNELADISRVGKVIEDRIEREIKKYSDKEKQLSLNNGISYEQSEWSKKYFGGEELKKHEELLSGNLWWKLRNYCFKRKNETELIPLFIFDQFEEVFTKASYAWTDAFFGWLEEISTDYVPASLRKIVDFCDVSEIPTRKNFKALFSFRTEYLGDLDYWCVQKHFLPSMQDNRICLKPLTPKGAMEIIKIGGASLDKYTGDIIRGCAENGIDVNKEQPCVYALILSVVCKTLSESPEQEREAFLNELKRNRDNAIDNVLLKFYKDKLKEVGLDYEKDSHIIAEIENALVNENGKRSRRDTDEHTMRPLSKWIDKLCEKNNGLVKIVGKREINREVVKTVEFPHDRLCKAIDSARKERQLRLAEKVIRQKEWIQFGIITIVFGIITYLISSSFHTIYKFFDNPSFCDEEHSTCILMLLLVLFSPILTLLLCYGKSRSKWQNIFILCTSTISTVSFGALLYCNKSNNIQFSQAYIPYVADVGLIVSCCILLLSSYRLFSSKATFLHDNSKNKSQSYWPLWGALLLIASYVFYLTVYDLSVGKNEPIDSFWGFFVLPLFYTLFVRGFYHIETNFKSKACWILVIGLIALLLLDMFFFYSHLNMPLHCTYWQNYGILFSVVMIATYCGAFIYSLWHSKTNNPFYQLHNAKRILASSCCVCITILAFYMSLGYNPFKVSTNSVVKVDNWRSIVVKSAVNGKTMYGILTAQGDTIIPYCLDLGENDSVIAKNIANRTYKIVANSIIGNPFSNYTTNTDASVTWSTQNKILIGNIISFPTLEEYLYKDIYSDIPINSTLEQSIDYYSRKLFVELRKANINWLRTGKKYDMANLPSYEKVEELQTKALDKTMTRFMQKSDSVGQQKRCNMQIMEDQDLVDLECSFVRSMLLCMLKDRCHHQDYPELISLQNTFLFAFFPDIPKMNFIRNVNTNFVINLKIDNKQRSASFGDHSIYTNADVLKKRAFVWYDMFYGLCLQDAKYNSVLFEKMYSDSFSTDSLKKCLNEIRKIANFGKVLEDKKTGENLDKNELIDIVNLILNFNNPDFWQSVKDNTHLQADVSDYIREDEQLKKIRKDVFDSLMICLNGRPTGLYNNCLEQTCKGIIIASAFRGYNIEENVEALKEYNKKKNEIHSSISTIVDARKKKQRIAEQNKELQSIFDSIIKKTKKKKK